MRNANMRAHIFLIWCFLFCAEAAQALTALEKQEDFLRNKKNAVKYEQERLSGLQSYLDEVDSWEKNRGKALNEFRKSVSGTNKESQNKRRISDFHEHERDQVNWETEREKARLAYATQNKKKSMENDPKWARFEMEELGLLDLRPRYNYKKRAGFGADSKLGKSTGSSPSSSSGGFGDSGRGDSGNSNSAPPYQNYPAYEPPPPMYEGDIPPPPPPPPFPEFEGDIPPPPPPPMYDGVDF